MFFYIGFSLEYDPEFAILIAIFLIIIATSGIAVIMPILTLTKISKILFTMMF